MARIKCTREKSQLHQMLFLNKKIFVYTSELMIDVAQSINGNKGAARSDRLERL